MEPATMMGTHSLRRTGGDRHSNVSGRYPFGRITSDAGKGAGVTGCRSVERVPAGAGASGVGVVDGEALLLDGVDEVDRRAVQVGLRHPVDGQADPAEVDQGVAVQTPVVEEEL